MIDGKKLSTILKNKNITSEQLSLILKDFGVKLGLESIKKYRGGKVNVPSATVSALAEILNITEQELYVNYEEQSKKIIKKELQNNIDRYLPYLPNNPMPSNIKKISLVNGYIGTGSSGLIEQEEIISDVFVDINTISKAYRQKEIKALKIVGDSMVPYIYGGDIVLYSLLDSTFSRFDGKYIVRINENLMLKNIHFKINGDIVISSQNKAYSDELIQKDSQEMDSFAIVGIVVGRILKS